MYFKTKIMNSSKEWIEWEVKENYWLYFNCHEKMIQFILFIFLLYSHVGMSMSMFIYLF